VSKNSFAGMRYGSPMALYVASLSCRSTFACSLVKRRLLTVNRALSAQFIITHASPKCIHLGSERSGAPVPAFDKARQEDSVRCGSRFKPAPAPIHTAHETLSTKALGRLRRSYP
jgi:hypothetical protein